MIVIGLTGSIGMGKSVAARMLRTMGCAVHQADAAVHRLLGPGGAAVAAVAQAFPGTLRGGAIDRQLLGKLVFGDTVQRQKLEAILHPLVQQEEQLKRQRVQQAGRRVLVLDIPLLFETGGDKRCDATCCVTASSAVQRARVLARPGMTETKFNAILAAQLPDAAKRERADFIIPTGYGRALTWWCLRFMLWRLALKQQHQ